MLYKKNTVLVILVELDILILFQNSLTLKNQWNTSRGRLKKYISDRSTSKKGKEECCKDDEIAMGARPRHRDFGIERALGHNGRITKVIPYHLPRYEQILKQCKRHPNEPVCALDLSLPTRFIAVYLFLQVKCSRPMTFQYLTTKMIETAKNNEGFVDQKQFKTAKTYGFDSLV